MKLVAKYYLNKNGVKLYKAWFVNKYVIEWWIKTYVTPLNDNEFDYFQEPYFEWSLKGMIITRDKEFAQDKYNKIILKIESKY